MDFRLATNVLGVSSVLWTRDRRSDWGMKSWMASFCIHIHQQKCQTSETDTGFLYGLKRQNEEEEVEGQGARFCFHRRKNFLLGRQNLQLQENWSPPAWRPQGCQGGFTAGVGAGHWAQWPLWSFSSWHPRPVVLSGQEEGIKHMLGNEGPSSRRGNWYANGLCKLEGGYTLSFWFSCLSCSSLLGPWHWLPRLSLGSCLQWNVTFLYWNAPVGILEGTLSSWEDDRHYIEPSLMAGLVFPGGSEDHSSALFSPTSGASRKDCSGKPSVSRPLLPCTATSSNNSSLSPFYSLI